MRLRCLGLIAIALAVPRAGTAKVASAPLVGLVVAADAIVVATVTDVSEDHAGTKLATATVEEALKGPAHRAVRFIASPSWLCDSADAVIGERVLLFLVRDDHGELVIAHSGRGRMPIRQEKGVELATIWTSDILLPANFPTFAGPDPDAEYIQSVELSRMRHLILSTLARVDRGENVFTEVIPSAAELDHGNE